MSANATRKPVRFPTQGELADEEGYGEATSWRARRVSSETHSTSRSWVRTQIRSFNEKATITESKRTSAQTRATKRFYSDAHIAHTPQFETATPRRRQRSPSTFPPFTSASRHASPDRLTQSRVSSDPDICRRRARFAEPCRLGRTPPQALSPVSKSPLYRRWGSQYDKISSFGLHLASRQPLAGSILPIVRLSVLAIFYLTTFLALASIVVSSYVLSVWDHFQHHASCIGDAAGQARRRIQHGVQWGRDAAGTIVSCARDAMEVVRAAGMVVVAIRGLDGGEEKRGDSARHQHVGQGRRPYIIGLFERFSVALGEFSSFAVSEERESETDIKSGNRVLAAPIAASETQSGSTSSASASSSSEPTPNPRPPLKFLLPSMFLAIVILLAHVAHALVQRATEGGSGKFWSSSASVKGKARAR
jgi:hypothetical protein